jgi:hypothetical protein
VSRRPKTHVLQGCSCPVSILPGYAGCTSGCSARPLHPVSRDHRTVSAMRNTYGPVYTAPPGHSGFGDDLPTFLRGPSSALMIAIPCRWFGIITNASRPTLAEWFGMSSQYLKAILPIFDRCTRLSMVLLLPASPSPPQSNSSRSTLALSPSRCSKAAARCPDQFRLRFSGEVPAAG